MTPTRPLLRYHGGKWKLAPWIIGHFPAHRVYVEPFAGAASVLLRKPPSFAEVLNDKDSEIVNLFRVLRDPASACRLGELLPLTPYSQEEFKAAYQIVEEPVERARRLLVRCWMAHGSGGANPAHNTGFRHCTSRQYTTPASDWAAFPEILPALVKRLAGVTIQHDDASNVIARHDAPDTLIYADPPYLPETRYRSKKCGVYSCEMTAKDHIRLAEALHAVKGMVILSGYDSDLYRDLYADWRKVACATFADGASLRTECLWISPRAASAARQKNLLEVV